MEELPPGFRFYPTEEELISFYLHHKLQGTRPDLDRVIPVVDIYNHEPWELPMMAGERGRGENEEQWFFFTAQQEREARGGKPNRTTTTGYWKATGSPGYVYSTVHTKEIGVKKTMVFYNGRAPVGKKTHWKMNEYKAVDFRHDHTLDASSSNAPPITKLRHEMSVCRVYITSGSSRAFDRRPVGSITTPRAPHREQPLRLQSADHNQQHLTTTTTTTTMNTGHANISTPLLVKKSSNSFDSCGGDQTDHLHESNNNNMNNDDDDDDDDDNMITSDLQPLWEWEQLNWP